MILEIKKHRVTVILSEQNLHFARLVADRAIIIESGEKRFDGTFAKLDSDPEVERQYLSVCQTSLLENEWRLRSVASRRARISSSGNPALRCRWSRRDPPERAGHCGDCDWGRMASYHVANDGEQRPQSLVGQICSAETYEI